MTLHASLLAVHRLPSLVVVEAIASFEYSGGVFQEPLVGDGSVLQVFDATACADDRLDMGDTRSTTHMRRLEA